MAAFVADPQTQERKLRAVQAAAASAVGNGCDPDEVRRLVETGIAEALALNNRQPAGRSAGSPLVSTPQPANSTSDTPTLDAWMSEAV